MIRGVLPMFAVAASMPPVPPGDLHERYLRVDNRIAFRHYNSGRHACSYPNDAFTCADAEAMPWKKDESFRCAECSGNTWTPKNHGGYHAWFCSDQPRESRDHKMVWSAVRAVYFDPLCQNQSVADGTSTHGFASTSDSNYLHKNSNYFFCHGSTGGSDPWCSHVQPYLNGIPHREYIDWDSHHEYTSMEDPTMLV